MTAVLVLWLLSADAGVADAGSAPGVSCKTVADCWLDENGQAIARPKAKKGKPVPRGDCGGNILWLRHRLACDEGTCKAVFIGDRC
jgi:hypothetical protein